MKQFKFEFDNSSKVKLYRQLFNIFVQLIESGELAEGEKIPSVRVFSSQNNISRNTVTHAYKDLIDTGYLYSQEKSGFYVKLPSSSVPAFKKNTTKKTSVTTEHQDQIPTVDSIIKEHNKNTDTPSAVEETTDDNSNIENLLISEKKNTFITTDPILSDPTSSEEINSKTEKPISNTKEETPVILPTGKQVFSEKNDSKMQPKKNINSPEEVLFSAYKQALQENQNILLKESSPFGDETLKIAIAAFLYKFHKLDVNPSQIIIGANIEQLFYNVLRLPSIQHPHKTLEGQGLLKLAESASASEQIQPIIAVTESTDFKLRTIFKSTGIDVKEIPMTEFGMNTNYLSTSGATIAFFSSADYLENSDLTLADPDEYTKELHDWVSTFNYRYLFEFDTSTIPQIENPRLNALDTNTLNQFIYFCSFKNLISSCVNSGFIILPKKLIPEYKNMYEAIGCQVSKLEQVALTELILSGKLLNYLENIEAL